MATAIFASFAFELDQPTDALLQFEAAALPDQTLLYANTDCTETDHFSRIAGQDSIGDRIWLRTEGLIEVQYSAEIAIHRSRIDLPAIKALPTHKIPGEAVPYLLDSRYCPADRFQNFVETEFAGTSGGARVDAIRQWIADHFTYLPGASGPYTDAAESFIMRQGVCRDYAHMLVTLARASTIPARYVACYAPDVDPQDFHAAAEVYLADPENSDHGTWQIVDATGMAKPQKTAKIGIGRDAADVSFLTTFGPHRFLRSSVQVSEV